MKKFSPFFIALFLAICCNVYAQQPARGTGSVTPQFVSAAQFKSLPAELQAIISVNPQLFFVEGKTVRRGGSSTSSDPSTTEKSVEPSSNSALSSVQTSHRVVSLQEFSQMSTEKRAHILSNSTQFTVEGGHSTLPLLPVAKHRISQTEMQSMSADKQAYINANLDKYEITN